MVSDEDTLCCIKCSGYPSVSHTCSLFIKKNTSGNVRFTVDEKSNRLEETSGDHLAKPAAQSKSNWIRLLRAVSS